jgi:NAD(P)-dependent dehydrogenase (short-subunit alcohol dehydrogenase family)
VITPTRWPVPGRFAGKAAPVTGGTHGIGFAIALELLREGAAVVASGLPADAEEGRAAFTAAGYSPLIVTGDLMAEYGM